MAESLAQAEEQRRHMVADIAHELRTPLTIIQGNLEAMLDGVLPLDAVRWPRSTGRHCSWAAW